MSGVGAGRKVKVAFVSDVTCPWCAIGLAGLEEAIARLAPDVEVELQIEPFELNPDIPAEGEDIGDYALRKYGAAPAALDGRQALIMARGAEAGLALIRRTRIWNTFDAHRLLHWAGGEGRAPGLKRALLAAYHQRGENPGDRAVLLACCREAGLDVRRAAEILDSDEHAAAVRARVRGWQTKGIHSVPSVVVDGRWLLQGGQTAAAYEQALRGIASRHGS